MEYLIIQHLSSPVCAKLNKVYCTRTWNWSSILGTPCRYGLFPTWM